MNSVNFNVVTPNVNYARLSDESTDKQTEQVNFKGKLKITLKPKTTKNNPNETIDMLNEHAVDLLNKKRPIAEQTESAIRRSISYFIDIIKFKKNPDTAREKLMRESLKDIGRFLKDV